MTVRVISKGERGKKKLPKRRMCLINAVQISSTTTNEEMCSLYMKKTMDF